MMSKAKGKASKAKLEEEDVVATASIVHLRLDKISIDVDWSKSYRSVLEESEVLASVKQFGILEAMPLRVVLDPRKQGRYILVDGETRYKGARLCNNVTVPCIILNMRLEEARRLAARLNGWPQEAVKKAPLAHILLEALEEVRAKNPPHVPRRLAVTKEEKERLVVRARVSITTIDRGLIALRKLYREFCSEDASLAKISVIECFWRKIQQEPDSNLALFYRDQIRLNKFLGSRKPRLVIRQDQICRRGQHHMPNLDGVANQASSASNFNRTEIVNANTDTTVRFSEALNFGESFARLIELVELSLLNSEEVTSSLVLEALRNLIQTFPAKLVPLHAVFRLLQRFEKKRIRTRKPAQEDSTVGAETAPAQGLLF
jgi:ParB-like chromosome segregation protein Spo0J